MRFRLILLLSILLSACSEAQTQRPAKSALANIAIRQHWVDSVYGKLNEDERIGQLFMVAAYSGGAHNNAPKKEKVPKKKKTRGLIFIQGAAGKKGLLINRNP